jgi:hypothetical protein
MRNDGSQLPIYDIYEVIVTDRRMCLNCGFESIPDDSEWDPVEAPPLGVLMQCPECWSTDITNRQQPLSR